MLGRVLVTDGAAGQARSTLATVRALGRGGYSPVVTVSGPRSLAAASRYCAATIRTPPASEGGYAQSVRAETDRRDYLCVLASSDAALLALEAGVDHLLDKDRLSEEARRSGIPVPHSARFPSFADLLERSGELDYPVVVKSQLMGPSVVVAHGAGDLERVEFEHRGPVLAQELLGPPLTSIAGVVWQGRLAASVHQRYLRTWPPHAGGACAAVSVEADVDLERRVTEVLRGYSGLFHAQFAAGRLIDLNPRTYGSLPLAVEAGVNLPVLYCDLVRGEARTELVRGRPGAYYRSLEGELRWGAHALVRDRLSPLAVARALRPRRHVAHAVESITDPRPVLVRLRHAAASGKLRGPGPRSDRTGV
jgi:predicted ATP-grasp superfamily ATP-dependent carboligase